ncbi:3-oxoacyl-(acyl-carrier-protein) synthase III [Rubidibacter lacunae KORDI 51-2]|uniref:Beta-ketoacyl-[acyl-carrier-protein] synthase III n=1 Tax=Rubidibacter lacunae KORDI 51-2 TaxID=582515 RepID=U5DG76_9CHRO|nr:beta-ketoacyl-ACP synthase III [Rubidibacter lacunae]ERN40272.1 3-oxoacyl-(acyl-carrier-protein) synthase III [Rubidibacter lacunae KORDI 51-2]
MNHISAGIAFTGSGSAAPAATLDNATLSQRVETSDEWIHSRTGMRDRRIAGPQETLAELAALAGERALAMAGITAVELDLIVLATSTPDDLFGSAVSVQHALGATRAVAFDLTAACSGFVFGMATAAQFLRTGTYRNCLLLGADVLSRWVDWDDRRTCVLFGDGAGAVVMQAVEPARDRLLGFELRSDGTLNHTLNLGFVGEAQPLAGDLTYASGSYRSISMNGREVYRFAVERVPEVISKALFRSQLLPEQLDWLLLHQANQRIMDAVAARLKLAPEQVISNIPRYGNTSAASIPLALDEYVRTGKVTPGHAIAAAGFGAGLTWGAAIFRWGP